MSKTSVIRSFVNYHCILHIIALYKIRTFVKDQSHIVLLTISLYVYV